MDFLTDYERQRLANIKRNKEILEALHIEHLPPPVSSLIKKYAPKKHLHHTEESSPGRRSLRLQGKIVTTPKKRVRLPSPPRERFQDTIDSARHQSDVQNLACTDDDSEKFKLIFAVHGASDKTYLVTIAESPNCTCPDQRIRKSKCKHMLCVMLRTLDLPIEHPFFARRGPPRLTINEVQAIHNDVKQPTVGASV